MHKQPATIINVLINLKNNGKSNYWIKFANKELTFLSKNADLNNPVQVYHFYSAVANAYQKKLENILVEELIVDIKGFTDTDTEKILIGVFDLEDYFK